MVEHSAVNRRVAGSSPAWRVTFKIVKHPFTKTDVFLCINSPYPLDSNKKILRQYKKYDNRHILDAKVIVYLRINFTGNNLRRFCVVMKIQECARRDSNP